MESRMTGRSERVVQVVGLVNERAGRGRCSLNVTVIQLRVWPKRRRADAITMRLWTTSRRALVAMSMKVGGGREDVNTVCSAERQAAKDQVFEWARWTEQ